MPRASDEIKQCAACKERKGINEFHRDSSKGDGLYSYCKECQRIKLRPLMSKIMRKRGKQNALAVKKHSYKIKFNLDLNDYNLLFERQEGRCAICGTHRTSLKIDLAIDHNHTTGKIRGLLCTKCNLMLGHANDSADILQRAIVYLDITKG